MEDWLGFIFSINYLCDWAEYFIFWVLVFITVKYTELLSSSNNHSATQEISILLGLYFHRNKMWVETSIVQEHRWWDNLIKGLHAIFEQRTPRKKYIMYPAVNSNLKTLPPLIRLDLIKRRSRYQNPLKNESSNEGLLKRSYGL